MYDKDFVARFVSGMDYLAEAVKDTTPEWQERHTGVPAAQLRAFVKEIAADAPHVIFNPGWGTARHKQSFHVSRTALILNVLMGNLEIPGGFIMAKSPETYGRKGLNHLIDRVPKAEEPRVDGAGDTRPQWDPEIGMLHQAFAAMETGQPYGIGAYFAYRHDPITGLPDTEAAKRALDKLKLFVSIDVRFSEAGWFADVILPEATYLERANILCQMGGPVPSFFMRDQAIAPRFDSRPAWWIFREILRRMDVLAPSAKEALDFETIEEILELPARWHRCHHRRAARAGVRQPGRRAEADRREELKFPTPSGKIEIESAILQQAGLPSLPPYTPKAAPADDHFHLLIGRTATLTHGQSFNNPLLNERAPEQALWIHPDRARPLGIGDGDTVEVARGWQLRRQDQGQGDTLDPSRGGLYVTRLRRHGAARHARPRPRRGRPAPAGRQALRLRPSRRRLRPDRIRRPNQAGRAGTRGGGRRQPVSTYILRHDEASCISCLACEVHCKSNKDLGPGPDPCKIITLGPIDVGGQPRMRIVFMPCFHCEDPWCVRACPTGAMQQREKDGIVHVDHSLCIGCKSCIAACPWGTPQWDPATRKVVKCDYCMERVDAGLQPACVTKCVTGCLSFGVANELPDPRRERYARYLVAEPLGEGKEGA